MKKLIAEIIIFSILFTGTPVSVNAGEEVFDINTGDEQVMLEESVDDEFEITSDECEEEKLETDKEGFDENETEIEEESCAFIEEDMVEYSPASEASSLAINDWSINATPGSYSAVISFNRNTSSTLPATYYVIAISEDEMEEADNGISVPIDTRAAYMSRGDFSDYAASGAKTHSNATSTGVRTGTGYYTYNYNMILSGLAPETRYYYRILASSNSTGSNYYFVSDVGHFETGVAPTTSSITASDVSIEYGAVYGRIRYKIDNPDGEPVGAGYKVDGEAVGLTQTFVLDSEGYVTFVFTRKDTTKTYAPLIRTQLGKDAVWTEVTPNDPGIQVPGTTGKAPVFNAESIGTTNAVIAITLEGGKEFEKQLFSNLKVFYKKTTESTYKEVLSNFLGARETEDGLRVDVPLTGLASGTTYDYYVYSHMGNSGKVYGTSPADKKQFTTNADVMIDMQSTEPDEYFKDPALKWAIYRSTKNVFSYKDTTNGGKEIALSKLANFTGEIVWGPGYDTSMTGGVDFASRWSAVANPYITDFTGIEYLPNVTSIKVAGKPDGTTVMTDISSLAKLSKLTTLAINNGGLTDISPIAGMTNLTSLTITNNGIADIPDLSALSKLGTDTTSFNLKSNYLRADTLVASKLPSHVVSGNPNWIKETLAAQKLDPSDVAATEKAKTTATAQAKATISAATAATATGKAATAAATKAVGATATTATATGKAATATGKAATATGKAATVAATKAAGATATTATATGKAATATGKAATVAATKAAGQATATATRTAATSAAATATSAVATATSAAATATSAAATATSAAAATATSAAATATSAAATATSAQATRQAQATATSVAATATSVAATATSAAATATSAEATRQAQVQATIAAATATGQAQATEMAKAEADKNAAATTLAVRAEATAHAQALAQATENASATATAVAATEIATATNMSATATDKSAKATIMAENTAATHAAATSTAAAIATVNAEATAIAATEEAKAEATSVAATSTARAEAGVSEEHARATDAAATATAQATATSATATTISAAATATSVAATEQAVATATSVAATEQAAATAAAEELATISAKATQKAEDDIKTAATATAMSATSTAIAEAMATDSAHTGIKTDDELTATVAAATATQGAIFDDQNAKATESAKATENAKATEEAIIGHTAKATENAKATESARATEQAQNEAQATATAAGDYAATAAAAFATQKAWETQATQAALATVMAEEMGATASAEAEATARAQATEEAQRQIIEAAGSAVIIEDSITGVDGQTYSVKLSLKDPVYNGMKKIPDVRVYDKAGKALQAGVDYKISFKNNKDANTRYSEEEGLFVADTTRKTPTYIIKFVSESYKPSNMIYGYFNINPAPIFKIATILPKTKKDGTITVKTGKPVKFLKGISVSLSNGKVKKLNAKKDLQAEQIRMIDKVSGRTYDNVSSAQALAGNYFIRVAVKGNYIGTMDGGTFELRRK